MMDDSVEFRRRKTAHENAEIKDFKSGTHSFHALRTALKREGREQPGKSTYYLLER